MLWAGLRASGTRRGYPRRLLRGAIAGSWRLLVFGWLYGSRYSLGQSRHDVVASAYLFDPVLQLTLEERDAIAEVGDGLVFGFKEGVHARLQDAHGLVDGGDTVGGWRGWFATILWRVALRLCECRARLFLPDNVLRARDILGLRGTIRTCREALGEGCQRAGSTVNDPYGYLPA